LGGEQERGEEEELEDSEDSAAERRGLRFGRRSSLPASIELPYLPRPPDERSSESTTATREVNVMGADAAAMRSMTTLMEGESSSSSSSQGDSEDAPEDEGSDNGDATERKEIRVVPTHGVPVAILAKRGQCSYETKARVASTLTTPHGTVRFLIVYDNVPGDGSRLITMSAASAGRNDKNGHELYKDTGLVFVSYESGVDLREYINTQSRRTAATGGPRILIDGSDHWVFPPMDESAAGLAFLLMLFGCVCSLSLFLNTTFYGGGRGSGESINEAHLFLLGPDGQTTARNNNAGQGSRRGGRGNGLRLLTLEEVETLPTREYCTRQPMEQNADLDSNLELRDKSEMPYLADEEVDHVDNEVDNEVDNDGQQQQEQGSTTLHDGSADHEEYSPPRQSCNGGGCSGGGGLCEHLLPTKEKDSYTFNQNSCSICLEDYEPGEQIRVLPCQHTFHSSCIFPWLTERSPTCPLCKAMFEAVQYEEEGEEGQHQEGDEGASGSNDEEDEEGVNGQPPPSDDVEGMAEASGNAIAPPSLEEEPPIHRRRASRRQRRDDRQGERASRRSRRDRTADDTAAAAAGASDGEGVAQAAASTNGNDTMASREEEPSSLAGARGRSSGESRGSWWGLFGAGATSTSTTDGIAASGNNALEEPLLTNEDGGNGIV